MKSIYFIAALSFSIASCSSSRDDSTIPSGDPSENESSFATAADQDVCDDLKSFVPKGWKIIKQPTGDLNKDGIEDVAMVIQKTDAANIKKENGMTIDKNSRTLLILFGKATKGCYELNTESKTFILAHEDVIMDDPFEGIEIKNGTLKISFKDFRSMGSWETSQSSYIWRFQDGLFKLIGANDSSFHRADGDATDLSINFSTNKYSLTFYNMFEEEDESEEEVIWKKLNVKTLKTFETFSQPWTWTINDEVHI